MRWVVVLSLAFFSSCSCSRGGDDNPDGRRDGGGGDGGGVDGGVVQETCAPAEILDCVPSSGTPGAEGVIVRGTVLASDRLLCSGDVLYSRTSGQILCVDENCGAHAMASGAPVLCADVISPGLINAHTHSNYGHLPPFQHAQLFTDKSDWQSDSAYRDFIAASGSPNGIRTSMSCEIGKWDETRQMIGGATSLLGAQGGTTNQTCLVGLMRDLDVATANELTRDAVNYEIILGSANGSQLASDVAQGIGASLHVAEGVTLAWRTSEWGDVNSGNLLVDRVNIVHGTALGVAELGELRMQVGSITWSPRSNIDLYGLTSPIPAMKNMGLSIAIGTDWTPSGSQDVLEELKCADHLNANYYDHAFTDAELVAMVTSNAARGILVDDLVGSLAVGLQADVTAFRGNRAAPFRAVLDAEIDDVMLVVVGGKARYGDAPLMSGNAVEENEFCEDLDVCGRPRRVCVKRTAGPDTQYRLDQTLPQVKTALETALAAALAADGCTGDCYQFDLIPLVQCDRPAPADVCTPGTASIPGFPSPDDMDGDGLANATDKCPRVFDPPLLGETAEADFDADGMGDACDPCPATSATVCDAPDPNDLDGDGVANTTDNCPSVPNMEQADGDSDDVGDVCDGCPGDTNPACFTVGVLRDPSRVGHPAAGTHVEISGLVVTAVKSSTPKGRQVWVQDPDVNEFGGLVLYFGSGALPPGIAVGNTVDVSGTYEEFFELSEITSPTVSITGTTTPITPMVLDPAMLATGGARAEPLESMLVTVSNVMVTNPNPDGPTNDYDEFAVTGNLRVDDLIIDGCDPGSTSTGCMGVAKTWGTFSGTYTITGVMTFSFSNTKLTPRSKVDDFDPDAP